MEILCKRGGAKTPINQEPSIREHHELDAKMNLGRQNNESVREIENAVGFDETKESHK